MLGEVRFKNLQDSVKRALKNMPNDGLAQQLELDKTSCKYVPQRLVEVLNDYIDAGREKLIQKMLHEIDNAQFERDKSEIKYQKLNTMMSNENKETQEESHRLDVQIKSTNSKISDIQQKQASAESRYQKTLSKQDAFIRRSQIMLAKSKASLSSLAADLSEIRADVTVWNTMKTRSVRWATNQLKKGSEKIIEERHHNGIQSLKSTLSSKERDIENAKSRTVALKSSITALNSYLNGLAASSSIKNRINDKDGNSFGIVLNQVAKAQEKNAVAEITKSQQNSRDYIISIQSEYEKKMKEKDQELDEIMVQARKRRLKLQAELDKALEQIKALQGNRSDDGEDDLLDELERSSHDIESTSKKLDNTLLQLQREVKQATVITSKHTRIRNSDSD